MSGSGTRIWRQEGLKVPQKQPKWGRLWLNNGTQVQLRANQGWSYDFVQNRTHGGRIYCKFDITDEYTKEALAIRVKPKLNINGCVGRPLHPTRSA
jgi:putative transposase